MIEAVHNNIAESNRRPFHSSIMHVEPQWINDGHVNVVYYSVLFRQAIRELWKTMGMGHDYEERKLSTFVAESHARYLREVHLDDTLQVSVLILEADEKRLHTFAELRHAIEELVFATSEDMTLHVDMSTRKVTPFPADIRERIAVVAGLHSAVPRAHCIGRGITMPGKR